MVFRARRDRGSHRFVEWQVGLFFLAAGIWGGAIVVGRPEITGVAVAVLLVSLLLGVLGRRLDACDSEHGGREEDDRDGSGNAVEGGPPDGNP